MLLKIPGKNPFITFSSFQRLPAFLGSWSHITPNLSSHLGLLAPFLRFTCLFERQTGEAERYLLAGSLPKWPQGSGFSWVSHISAGAQALWAIFCCLADSWTRSEAVKTQTQDHIGCQHCLNAFCHRASSGHLGLHYDIFSSLVSFLTLTRTPVNGYIGSTWIIQDGVPDSPLLM